MTRIYGCDPASRGEPAMTIKASGLRANRKRRIEVHDLAVHRDPHPRPSDADEDLSSAQGLELLGTVQSAHERSGPQGEQPRGAERARDVKGEATGLEAGASDDREMFQLIRVRADEEQRGAPLHQMAVGGEREIQQPGRLQKLPSGRHIGQQLTAPEPPIQPFALGEHRRVQPDARVVQKQVSIDLPDSIGVGRPCAIAPAQVRGRAGRRGSSRSS